MASQSSVSVLVTGSEVLDGRVLDTNSHFVAEQLSRIGLRLENVLSCDDDLAELNRGLAYLCGKSRLVITSGGLGPTADDLTRFAVADFCGVDLVQSQSAVSHLEQFFAQRGRVLDESNLQQALLPRDSTMIPNPLGTAPGFIACAKNGAVLMSLSGVPREFSRMFEDSVMPRILEEFKDAKRQNSVGLKVFGLPESVVGKLVKDLNLPQSLSVSYRAFFPEVHIVLKGQIEESVLIEMQQRVVAALGNDFVFAHDIGQSFEASILRVLSAASLTIATAESCTGGLISAMLTHEPGSSAVYRGGICSYSNDLKETLLGVSHRALTEHGAVSSCVAEEMAVGVRERLGADIGLSMTGIAGPDGGSCEKPVGTFFIGLSIADRTFNQPYRYSGPRASVRKFAAFAALDLVRRTLKGYQIPGSLPWVPQSK